MIEKGVACFEDMNGDGPSIFSRTEKRPVVEVSSGLNLPLKLCVENCKSAILSPRWLYFEGSLYVSASPLATMVNARSQ